MDGTPTETAMFMSGDSAGSYFNTTLAAFSLYVCVSRLLREYVPVSSSKMAIGSKIELGRVISILFVFFVKLFLNFS